MDGNLQHCTGGGEQDHTQKKKKMQEGKWLTEEALQIAENRRKSKGKGERGTYTQLSAAITENSKEWLRKQWKKAIELGKIEMSARKLEIPREQTFNTKMRKINVKSL